MRSNYFRPFGESVLSCWADDFENPRLITSRQRIWSDIFTQLMAVCWKVQPKKDSSRTAREECQGSPNRNSLNLLPIKWFYCSAVVLTLLISFCLATCRICRRQLAVDYLLSATAASDPHELVARRQLAVDHQQSRQAALKNGILFGAPYSGIVVSLLICTTRPRTVLQSQIMDLKPQLVEIENFSHKTNLTIPNSTSCPQCQYFSVCANKFSNFIPN